jgi:hypothetical protein
MSQLKAFSTCLDLHSSKCVSSLVVLVGELRSFSSKVTVNQNLYWSLCLLPLSDATH